jgi:hypothetical protein
LAAITRALASCWFKVNAAVARGTLWEERPNVAI